MFHEDNPNNASQSISLNTHVISVLENSIRKVQSVAEDMQRQLELLRPPQLPPIARPLPTPSFTGPNITSPNTTAKSTIVHRPWRSPAMLRDTPTSPPATLEDPDRLTKLLNVLGLNGGQLDRPRDDMALGSTPTSTPSTPPPEGNSLLVDQWMLNVRDQKEKERVVPGVGNYSETNRQPPMPGHKDERFGDHVR
eukprot:gene6335-2557_t